MKFLQVSASILAVAIAAPMSYEGPGNSLTQAQAQLIIQQYQSLVQYKPYNGMQPEDTAKQLLADNYMAYSDSVKSLTNQPVRP
jgi:hypothetical protein